MVKTMVIVLLALATSSCMMREYSRLTVDPNGIVEVVHARTAAFLVNTEAENIKVESDRNKRSLQVGKVTVKVDSEAVGAIADGVVLRLTGL